MLQCVDFRVQIQIIRKELRQFLPFAVIDVLNHGLPETSVFRFIGVKSRELQKTFSNIRASYEYKKSAKEQGAS